MLDPTLPAGDLVVLDNHPGHKVAGVRDAIETRGAKLFICRRTRLISIQSNKLSQAQAASSKDRRPHRSHTTGCPSARYSTASHRKDTRTNLTNAHYISNNAYLR